MAKLMSRRRFTKVVISDKFTINRRNFSGAPVLLARNSAAAESEGEAGIHFPHTPFSARLARASGERSEPIIRDFVQNEF